MYPDTTIVQYLRSSQNTFTLDLEKYKEESRKPYSKIHLYKKVNIEVVIALSCESGSVYPLSFN